MNIWTGYRENQLKRVNIRVDEEIGRAKVMIKGRMRKVLWFTRNEFRKNIGCLILSPTFGIGGSILCYNEE